MKTLLFTPFFIFACCTTNLKNEKSIEKLEQKTIETIEQKWVNVAYLKCLEVDLPCNCMAKVDSYAMTLVKDSINPFLLEYDGNSDYDYHYVLDSIKNLAGLYSDKTKKNFNGTISINGKKLDLIKQTKKSTFVDIKHLVENATTNSIEEVNSIYLDTMLQRTYGKSFLDLVGKQPKSCSCNNELGRINIVKIDSENFIVEMDKDSISIYKYFPKENKSYPIEIDKKLFIKYGVK